MRKMLRKIVFILLATFFVWGVVESSVPTLPLSQVKAGMKGKGKSVFEENRIEEFDVEIVGVLQNFEPKRNLIIAKLGGRVLDKSGVIQGMSGSPVYIDGKLIGAVAYTIGTFPKETFAGITPIEEMLSISQKATPRSIFPQQVPLTKSLSLDELFELSKDFFLPQSAFSGEGKTYAPLSIPLIFSGFSAQVFERARSFYSQLGFSPMRGSLSAQSIEKISPPDLSLQEGDPVAIQWVEGDMDVSAVGTVTHIDGNRVLAFGHPVANMGAVDYGMTKAKVLAVVPSLYSSFKIAATGIQVGRFFQDRASGVLGELGKFPQMVPVNIKVADDAGKAKEFSLKIARDRILTPTLLNFSLMNILSSEERAVGDLSLGLDGDVYLENSMSVHLEDFFSGNFDTPVTSLSNLLAAVVYLLTNNEFKELRIHKIDLNVAVSEEAKFAYLEKVWLDKYEASPNERIQIKIYVRALGGQSILQEVGISAPNLPSGSEFQLVVADAATMHQIEMSQYRAAGFVPRSLNQLVRMLSNLRKNNRIYFKIIASKPGLFLKGEEMPNLPPTMKSMFSSPRAAASSPTELDKSTLGEYQLPVPSVFKGAAFIPIKIKK